MLLFAYATETGISSNSMDCRHDTDLTLSTYVSQITRLVKINYLVHTVACDKSTAFEKRLHLSTHFPACIVLSARI